MSLFDDLIPLKQELLGIPYELGHPDYLDIRVTHDGTEYDFRAKRTSISYSQQQWLLTAGVKVNTDMTGISSIPRNIPLEVLHQGIWTIGTNTYRSLNTDIESSLTYRTILNKVRNR